MIIFFSEYPENKLYSSALKVVRLCQYVVQSGLCLIDQRKIFKFYANQKILEFRIKVRRDFTVNVLLTATLVAALGQYHCVALTEHSWRCSRLQRLQFQARSLTRVTSRKSCCTLRSNIVLSLHYTVYCLLYCTCAIRRLCSAFVSLQMTMLLINGLF